MARTILTTLRFLLREMDESDDGNLLLLNSNPNVMKYLRPEPVLETREQALETLRTRILPEYALRGVGRWAVIHRETEAFVGYCGIKYIPQDEEYDLGYRFIESCWGKGYATECAQATLDYGRSRLAGQRIVGKAFLGNLASIRVLEKIGMRYVGDQTYPEGVVAVYLADNSGTATVQQDR